MKNKIEELLSEIETRTVNKEYLLGIIKTQLGITDEDMRSIATVKAKVREAKIDTVLDKSINQAND
jgi:hypothetical protein